MSTKKSDQGQHVNGVAKGDEIRPPADAPVGGPVSDDQLASMQDAMFEKKPDEPPPPEPKKPSHKSKAEEVFKRAQSANKPAEAKEPKKVAPKKPAEDEEDFSLIDTTLALLSGEDTDEPKADDDSNPSSGEEDDDDVPDDDTPEPDDASLDKETNIKNLRTIAKTAKSEVSTLQAKVAELEAAAKNQPPVAALQTELTNAKTRIQQLEQYEMLFALQDNPEFRAKFIDGAKTLTGEMKAIAKDYGVDEALMDEVLSLTNRREIDEFLSENFDSAEARQDIKALKQKYDGLQREKKEFEKKPGESYAQFEQRKAQKETQLLAEREAHLARIKSEGWAQAISANQALPRDRKIYELIEIPGKKDHNEKIVRPTLAAANQFLATGLNHIEKAIRTKSVLSPQFVAWFSTICQQAAATQMVNFTRLGLHKKLQEKTAAENKNRSMERPGLSTGGRTVAPSGGKKSKDGKDVAANIFESVMQEAQD